MQSEVKQAYQANRAIGLTAVVAWNFAKYGNGADKLGRFPIFRLHWNTSGVRCWSISGYTK